MLRLVFTRRWLTALAVATLFAIAAYYLGVWQYGKYEAKAARNAVIHAHYAADPVPVASILPGDALLTKSQDWTRVRETGTYADLPQLLVRNRVKGSAPGYEVVAAFTMKDGRTIAVDRGWVGLSDKGAAAEPDVPPTPTGPVTVTGWLRQGEKSDHRRMPTDQLATLDLGEASRQWEVPVVGAYLNLQTERLASGMEPPRPLPLDPPDTDLGVNQAYAYQWWLFMVCGFGLVYLGIRRDYRELHPELVAARPKKVRIWDEEDE
ncbi:conserved exported hypothetical protein [Nostocoides japonicum T1-X7]|uniref:SURF1-like protein n=1 Tax=Nostocoides japonicum T1-X7 TaxID=1194083 RepID=A0A077M6E7_9MICO|nr:SURF1 family protein [Tetrasphaera japonica]CCH79719.1 conserved exported hypothetical protein [Tetrasphaera japonica T1-X7]